MAWVEIWSARQGSAALWNRKKKKKKSCFCRPNHQTHQKIVKGEEGGKEKKKEGTQSKEEKKDPKAGRKRKKKKEGRSWQWTGGTGHEKSALGCQLTWERMDPKVCVYVCRVSSEAMKRKKSKITAGKKKKIIK